VDTTGGKYVGFGVSTALGLGAGVGLGGAGLGGAGLGAGGAGLGAGGATFGFGATAVAFTSIFWTGLAGVDTTALTETLGFGGRYSRLSFTLTFGPGPGGPGGLLIMKVVLIRR
jgi:hypothetical protein